jgi:hypothetical protein
MRDLFTWVALALAVALPDHAEAGCRRGRLFHRGANCSATLNSCGPYHRTYSGSCAQVATKCYPTQSFNNVEGSCAPVTGNNIQPARVRLFNGGRCGPNGCP